ncbi:hypothetical protein [Sinisalibacter aestuarii]|uniref:Alpha/beta hydrolase n=1 Tax=Sinisalibacter aestuarii TaxID=2949426 RepID=A0ABQ5LSN4_9RHOB|nr:hypothetical protein [Sinisalibacter aestuarii]GKY88009.1 hypothetical protein STA1M1_18780 [Sinisalibacter aestuarii]
MFKALRRLGAFGQAKPEPRPWSDVLAACRASIWAPADQNTLAELDDELGALLGAKALNARMTPIARLYRSMIEWRRSGVFHAPFNGMSEARLQFWEIEWHCPVLGYQRAFVQAMFEARPDTNLAQKNKVVFEHMPSEVPDVRETRDLDIDIMLYPGAERTIIAFSGLNGNCLGIGWTMFYRAVACPARANLVVLKDVQRMLYLKGLASVGDFEATKARLRDLVDEYSALGEVIFLGGSGGTFGALAFGSGIGKVRRVVALAGPTSLEIGGEHEDKQVYRRIFADMQSGLVPHKDIAALVNGSGLERVDFFVSGGHEFDMAQMAHLKDNTKVVVPYIYDCEHHSMTDMCIADGRLISVVKGEKSRPVDLR